MPQSIPITLQWGQFTGSFVAGDINELGVFIAQQMAGAIRSDVSFMLITVNDPATEVTKLIYNTSQNLFKVWDTGTGRYLANLPFAIGDVKNSVVGTDTISTGWVVLDGRAIAAIPGISGSQQTHLQNLFNGGAPGGNIPTVTPANINGLPADGSFSAIIWPPSINPVVTPAAGVIGALPFTNPATDTEAEALRNQTEILRTSAQDAFDVTKQIQAVAENTLVALNNAAGTPIYALVFCGLPGP